MPNNNFHIHECCDKIFPTIYTIIIDQINMYVLYSLIKHMNKHKYQVVLRQSWFLLYYELVQHFWVKKTPISNVKGAQMK